MNLSEFDPTAVSDITCDSRCAGHGTAFFCLKGAQSDGHDYAASAYRAGCRLFICEHSLSLPDDARQLVVPDSRIALAEMSSAFYGRPTEKLRMIGVTGTKGKSTVSSLIYQILNAAGIKTGLIGTTGIFFDGHHSPTMNSTPESYILHRECAAMLKGMAQVCVLEVSSQAYRNHRVHGIHFDTAVFTNLSPDHISPVEHPNYEHYRMCKSQLFCNCSRAVLNADDPESEYMLNCLPAASAAIRYGIENPAPYRAVSIEMTLENGLPGIRYELEDAPGETYRLHIPGTFNVSNALAATAVCEGLGIERSVIARTLEQARIPGRFEAVGHVPGRAFIVDYAHNGLSLSQVLRVLRSYSPRRLVCVFGSVGGRTVLRREEMGKAAGELADFCILTSDNPDEEDPMQIIHDIETHLGNCPHVCIADRREAVAYAVENSREGDVILFAGKGHEDYQLIHGVHVPYDERETIRQAIAALIPEHAAE